MSLTSRRKRPLDRQKVGWRDANLIVIASEGTKTEKQYFEFEFLKNLRTHIKILNTENGESAPKYVIARLDGYKADYELNDDDQLWLMFDIDRWDLKQLNIVVKDALQKGYKLAISNPSFELWLLLHLRTIEMEENFSKKNQLEKEIRSILGEYSKVKLKIEHYADKLETAIINAEKIDDTGGTWWPEKNGSQVYIVVKEILKLK